MDPAVCGLAEHPAAKTQLLEWVGGGNHLRFRGLRENRQRKKKPQAYEGAMMFLCELQSKCNGTRAGVGVHGRERSYSVARTRKGCVTDLGI